MIFHQSFFPGHGNKCSRVVTDPKRIIKSNPVEKNPFKGGNKDTRTK